MYAILNGVNEIADFETRDLPLSELVHEDFRNRYIEIPSEHTLKRGDIWNAETESWDIVEDSEITTEPVRVEPVQLTNSEIAQMISDLQADLLIAGVIV